MSFRNSTIGLALLTLTGVAGCATSGLDGPGTGAMVVESAPRMPGAPRLDPTSGPSRDDEPRSQRTIGVRVASSDRRRPGSRALISDCPRCK